VPEWTKIVSDRGDHDGSRPAKHRHVKVWENARLKPHYPILKY
jgi:hypothetical protein